MFRRENFDLQLHLKLKTHPSHETKGLRHDQNFSTKTLSEEERSFIQEYPGQKPLIGPKSKILQCFHILCPESWTTEADSGFLPISLLSYLSKVFPCCNTWFFSNCSYSFRHKNLWIQLQSKLGFYYFCLMYCYTLISGSLLRDIPYEWHPLLI